MSYERLLKIDKPFFSQEDVAYALGIKLSSAEVLCSRYVTKGLLTRLKRGLYARTETLAHLGQLDLFRIANFLQVPSYISLMTALSYYGLTTQVQRGFFESISIKRTRTFEPGEFTFRYTKISPNLYGGFEKKTDVFIALPEKAILDSFYLASLGRYALDVPSLDLTKINEQRLSELATDYPLKSIKYFERRYGKIRKS
jgi:predicted transcriptional regulator of viral defense system